MFGRTAAVGGVATCLVVLTLAFAGAYAQQAQPPAVRDPTRPTLTPAPAQSSQARSPRNASYTITARLDPASRTLTGEALLTWRNTATIPATSLRFHLYYNAWRNTRSTWMREAALAGDTELTGRPEADWGWIDVTSLKLVGTSGAPVDVTSSLRFIAPDDGNLDDRTVAEVPLAGRGGAGRDRQRADRLVVARPANVRAHGGDRQLLLPRAVVPENRGPPGHRLELPSVPRRDRVLL